MSRKLTRILAGATFLAFQSSDAAIIVSQTASFPGTTAVETFETPNNGGGLTIINSRRATQTFQVTTGFTIDKIYLGISTTGINASETFSVSIFTVSDTNAGNPNSVPTGTNLLTTTTEVASLGTAGSGGFLTLDLTGTDEIFLAATTGTAGYALQIQNTNSTGAFIWLLNAAGDSAPGSDQYAAGQAYETDLGGGTNHGNSDFVLGFTAIPEPSTALLGGLGLLALLRRRRA